MARRLLSFEDRAQIAVGAQQGLSNAAIGALIGRDRTVVWKERKRNALKTRGYQPVNANEMAAKRRRREQTRKIDADPVLAARIRADLKRSRTPRQIAGRLRLEATDGSVEPVKDSPPAAGATVSHEALYRWIYAVPKGELAAEGILLRSKRTARKRRKPLGERTGGRIVGMVSIDDRPEALGDRRVPGSWEGDLIIGKGGKSAAATLVERMSRFVIILALTWDQGSEMARHARLTVATDMPVYFAHPRSPWERPSNENTNGLIREYLPKGTEITDHQPYLNAIADELNDRPRQTLGFSTPREVFTRLLAEGAVASTA